MSGCRSYNTSNDGTAEVLTEDDKTFILSTARRMAGCGLRVLAMAYGPTMTTGNAVTTAGCCSFTERKKENDNNLIFAGLVGMEDPPRKGKVRAIRQMRRGGIKVVMLTGDSKETAIAIAKRCSVLGSFNDTDLVDDHKVIGDGTKKDDNDGCDEVASTLELVHSPTITSSHYLHSLDNLELLISPTIGREATHIPMPQRTAGLLGHSHVPGEWRGANRMVGGPYRSRHRGGRSVQ